jgi:hypothetical protein
MNDFLRSQKEKNCIHAWAVSSVSSVNFCFPSTIMKLNVHRTFVYFLGFLDFIFLLTHENGIALLSHFSAAARRLIMVEHCGHQSNPVLSLSAVIWTEK